MCRFPPVQLLLTPTVVRVTPCTSRGDPPGTSPRCDCVLSLCGRVGTGYDAVEMLQTDATYFVHSDDRAALSAHFRMLVATLANGSDNDKEGRASLSGSSLQSADDASGHSNTLPTLRSQRSHRKSNAGLTIGKAAIGFSCASWRVWGGGASLPCS